MTLTNLYVAELTQEAETTRRVLARVPEEKLSWRPHPKSMSLGQLALHIARIPGAIAGLLSETEREIPEVPRPEAGSRQELQSTLDESVAAATQALAAWGEAGLAAEWRMTRGENTVLALPRSAMVRAVMLNHWYHHRGQLTVYLRLLGVPLPPVYGDTADENPFA